MHQHEEYLRVIDYVSHLPYDIMSLTHLEDLHSTQKLVFAELIFSREIAKQKWLIAALEISFMSCSLYTTKMRLDILQWYLNAFILPGKSDFVANKLRPISGLQDSQYTRH